MSKPTRTPLTDNIRYDLKRKARSYVASFKKEHAELLSLATQIDKLFLAKIAKITPASDLAVLKKYSKGQTLREIKYHTDSGLEKDGQTKRCSYWTLKTLYHYPHYNGPVLRNITDASPLGKLLNRHNAISSENFDRLEALVQHYYNLIDRAVTVEEVAAIWTQAQTYIAEYRKAPKSWELPKMSQWQKTQDSVLKLEQNFASLAEQNG